MPDSPVVYYSHPMSIYGSHREAIEFGWLCECFGPGNVICPNRMFAGLELGEERTMRLCLEAVRCADAVVVSPGRRLTPRLRLAGRTVAKQSSAVCRQLGKRKAWVIGRGSYEEVRLALHLNKPVFCLQRQGAGYHLLPVTHLKPVGRLREKGIGRDTPGSTCPNF